MEPSSSVVQVDDAFGLGTHLNVVIMVWRGEAIRERLRAASALVERHAVACGEPVGVISVIEEGAPPPDEEDQRAIGEDHRAFARHIWAAAFVLEGVGSEAALEAGLAIAEVRGEVPFAVKYGADVQEAAAWLSARCPEGARERPIRDGIVRAVERVRAAVDACW